VSESADEFSVIRDLFAPLAVHEGARALLDDAAVLEASGRWVITTDAIVEGVHFLSGDPIETVAMKALRVNVSDIVAKGARPSVALLTLLWPNERPASELSEFAAALGRDLEFFSIALVGGDTSATPGPLVVSITLLGEPLGPRTPARRGARAGDDVWLIGGEIGSAWLGLQLRTGALGLDALRRGRDQSTEADSRAIAHKMPAYLHVADEPFDAEAAWLMSAYLAPFVRLECAPIVSRFASASMDVSDGLLADAGKLAAASEVSLRIVAEAVPYSIPAERWLAHGGDMSALLNGGDDYVVLFTAAPGSRGEIEAAEGSQALRLSRIGVVEEGAGVSVVDRNGARIDVSAPGYSHKLGR
jgi:thiamine-monophosphate kinase